MKNTGFGSYYWQAVTKPGQVFEYLTTRHSGLRFALLAVLIQAVIYTFVYLFLIFGGGRPFKPWLDIAPEQYYRFNVFFCAPSMLLGWVLAAGVMQLVKRAFSPAGTFEQVLTVTGFGIGIATWSTAVHDLLTSFLGAISVISQPGYEIALNSPTIWRTLLWIQMGAYLVWFVVLFSTGARVVYKVARWQALIIGTIGFLTYQMFFFIFNR